MVHWYTIMAQRSPSRHTGTLSWQGIPLYCYTVTTQSYTVTAQWSPSRHIDTPSQQLMHWYIVTAQWSPSRDTGTPSRHSRHRHGTLVHCRDTVVHRDGTAVHRHGIVVHCHGTVVQLTAVCQYSGNPSRHYSPPLTARAATLSQYRVTPAGSLVLHVTSP